MFSKYFIVFLVNISKCFTCVFARIYAEFGEVIVLQRWVVHTTNTGCIYTNRDIIAIWLWYQNDIINDFTIQLSHKLKQSYYYTINSRYFIFIIYNQSNKYNFNRIYLLLSYYYPLYFFSNIIPSVISSLLSVCVFVQNANHLLILYIYSF